MELAEVRRAKDSLRAKFEACSWFRGVGIAPAPSGFTIRLSVDPSSGVARSALPETWEGIPVEVVFMGTYTPRSHPTPR